LLKQTDESDYNVSVSTKFQKVLDGGKFITQSVPIPETFSTVSSLIKRPRPSYPVQSPPPTDANATNMPSSFPSSTSSAFVSISNPRSSYVAPTVPSPSLSTTSAAATGIGSDHAMHHQMFQPVTQPHNYAANEKQAHQAPLLIPVEASIRASQFSSNSMPAIASSGNPYQLGGIPMHAIPNASQFSNTITTASSSDDRSSGDSWAMATQTHSHPPQHSHPNQRHLQ
jgi:hypothetical protein